MGVKNSKLCALTFQVDILVGLSPSGKATGFDLVIPGSNPGSPAIEFSYNFFKNKNMI